MRYSHRLIGRALGFLAWTVGGSLLAGPKEVTREAIDLLDTAARGPRNIPAYVVTSYVSRQNHPVVIKEFVHNGPGHSHLCRYEVSTTGTNNAPKTDIYLQGIDGAWAIKADTASKLLADPQFLRPIPVRLRTASLLGIRAPLEYSVERGVKYFGIPSTKITISVPESERERFRADSRLLVAAMKERRRMDGAGEVQGTEEAQMKAAIMAFPAMYVYFVSDSPAFILSWQAFSFTDEKIDEVNFQEFSVPPSLDDSLFEIPHGIKIMDRPM